MATYNREDLIAESLLSISNQTYEYFECIIIDDGSNNKTFEKISPFMQGDERFTYYRRSSSYTKGLPGSRNYGLDIAQGKYVLFCDDDDSIHPDLLTICLKVFEDKQYDFVKFEKESFVDFVPTFKDQKAILVKNRIDKNNIIEILDGRIGFASCTVLWKVEVFRKKRFKESLQYAEELELYTRLLINGAIGAQIDNVLYYNRKHPNSNTGEFWRGSEVRTTSYTESLLEITQNLITSQMLDYKIARYLVWMTHGFTKGNILKLIIQKSKLTWLQKVKLKMLYLFKFQIQKLMIFKKRFV